MSLDFLTRPIGGKKAGPEASAAPSPRERRRGAPNPEDVRRPGAALAVGGSPRVDLMPPEIRVKRSQLALRRKLRLGLIAVAGVVVLGCGATVALSTVAGIGLTAAQGQQVSLLQEQAKYSEVKTATDSIDLIKAGQRVGGSTEIDWNGFLGKLAAIMPAGTSIKTLTITQATPVTPYESPQGSSRVASLILTTSSPGIPELSTVLTSMKTLPGYVGAAPSAVVFDASTNTYTSTIALDIDRSAFDQRFDAPSAQASAAGGQ